MSVNLSGDSNLLPTPKEYIPTTKDVEKLSKAMMDLQILEAAVKASEEMAEQVKDTASNTKPNKDTAKLEESSAEKEKKAERIKLLLQTWKMEIEEKAWKEILEWKPDSRKSLTENIQQLKEIFMALKSEILHYTSGDEWLLQMGKLENVLLQSLEKLIDVKIDSLLQFMGKYGQLDTVAMIKASLYQAVTGEKLTVKDAEKFLNFVDKSQGNRGAEATVRQQRTEIKQTERKDGTMQVLTQGKTVDAGTKSVIAKEGMIYQHSGGTKVSVDNGYKVSTDQFSKILMSPELQKDAVKTDVLFQIQKGSREELITTKLVTLFDLERSSSFVKHMDKEGIPFAGISLAKSNEELVGVLTGMAALKTQVFSVYSGISDNMATVLRGAVDDLIAAYLFKAPFEIDEDIYYVRKDSKYMNSKEILRIYNYILSIFNETKNPKEAIMKGLSLALEIFKGKQEEEEKNGQFSFRKNGFFFGADGKKAYLDFKEGIREIKNNWNRFIKESGLKLFTLDSDFEKRSLWGAAAKPKKESVRKEDTSSTVSLSLWSIFLF